MFLSRHARLRLLLGLLLLSATCMAVRTDPAKHSWTVVVPVADVVHFGADACAPDTTLGAGPPAWIGELAVRIPAEDGGRDTGPVRR